LIKIFILIILLSGCADFSSFAIGAAGSLVGSIITKELIDKEKESECKQSEEKPKADTRGQDG
tara:strand:+ start:530 stop:718 length:189 start_codon:yes stop_codon:yes gene_type:complete